MDYDILCIERGRKYSNDLYIFCRTREKPHTKRIMRVIDFKPYFFIKEKDHDMILDKLKNFYDYTKYKELSSTIENYIKIYNRIERIITALEKGDVEESKVEKNSNLVDSLLKQVKHLHKDYKIYTELKTLHTYKKSVCEHEEGKWFNFEDDLLIKLYTTCPDVVPDVREALNYYNIESYESNIMFDKRFRYDYRLISSFRLHNDLEAREQAVSCSDIESINEPYTIQERINYIDIETPHTEFEEPTTARVPIALIGILDTYTNKLVQFVFREDFIRDVKVKKYKSLIDDEEFEWEINYFPNESSMLYEWIQYVSQNNIDLFAGWNSSKWNVRAAQQQPYDFPYILNRLKKLRIKMGELSDINTTYLTREHQTIIKGREVLDLMEMYEFVKRGGVDSLSLNNVVQKELEHTMPKESQKILDRYKNDIDALLLYNVEDIDACRCIDKKMELIDFAVSFKIENGGRIDDLVSPVRVHDNFLFYNKSNKQLCYPIPPNVRSFRIPGAMVIETEPAIVDWVSVIDESKIYPSIILSGNISYETYSEKKEGIRFPSGYYFKQDTEGLVAANIRIMLEFRKQAEIKAEKATTHNERDMYKRRIMAIKALTNSIYGVLNNPYFRLYRPEASLTVTDMGQRLLGIVKYSVETLHDYNVVAGDTDSIFVHMKTKDEIVKCTSELITTIQRQYDEFAECLKLKEHHFKIEHEKILKKVLFIGKKKRYAGYCVWEDGKWLEKDSYILIRGFESRRGDSSNITSEVQQRSFEMILIEEKTAKQVFDYWLTIYNKILKNQIDVHECVPSPKLSKPPEEYGTTIYGVAAQYSNQNLPSIEKIHKGDKVYYVYIKEVPKGYPNTHVIALKEDDELPKGFVPDWKKIAEKAIKEKFMKSLAKPLNIPNDQFKLMGD